MPRIFAIGDIHGCVDELCVLLDHIAPDSDDTLVFLGDYIDRGPTPKGVVDRLLRLREEGPRCLFLRGNHEDMLLGFLQLGGHYGDAFLYNGGASTLRSYGIEPEEGMEGAGLAKYLSDEHMDFYQRLLAYYCKGDFLFVHAGVRPGIPLELQSPEDLFWIREEFTGQPHDLNCTVLYGHTPYREVFVDLPYKLGLDTGLVYRNKLSCFDIVGKTLHQVARGARRASTRSLADLFE